MFCSFNGGTSFSGQRTVSVLLTFLLLYICIMFRDITSSKRDNIICGCLFTLHKMQPATARLPLPCLYRHRLPTPGRARTEDCGEEAERRCGGNATPMSLVWLISFGWAAYSCSS